MILENNTTCTEAEAFLRRKLEGIKTEFPRNRKLGKELQVFLKWSTGKQPMAGYCRYKDFFVTCRINKDLTYPYSFLDPVGTQTRIMENGGRAWTFVTQQVTFNDAEEAMVYLIGHEMWHFLCKTKQAKGNRQTKANLNGIKWLDEFRLKK